MPTTYLEAIREGLWRRWSATPMCSSSVRTSAFTAARSKSPPLYRAFRHGAWWIPDLRVRYRRRSIGAGLMGLRRGRNAVRRFHFCGFDQIVNFAAKCAIAGTPRPMVVRAPSAAHSRRALPFAESEMWFVKTPPESICPATAYDAKGLIKSAVRDNDR